MDLLRLLAAARWLTTGQVRRRFFASASLSATRRRLRILARTGYVRKHQENRMYEAVFALGIQGKRVLERSGNDGIALERRPPKQLEHLTGINDIRIAAEMAGGLAYFFAAWELPGIGWKLPMVPDAVFQIADRTFAAEYDRGLEGLKYFALKTAWYRSGPPELPLAAVLVVADRDSRRRTLADAIGDRDGRFFCTTIEAVRSEGLPRPMRGDAGPGCSDDVSRRENGFISASSLESGDCKNSEEGS
jgi:hypothetical protein